MVLQETILNCKALSIILFSMWNQFVIQKLAYLLKGHCVIETSFATAGCSLFITFTAHKSLVSIFTHLQINRSTSQACSGTRWHCPLFCETHNIFSVLLASASTSTVGSAAGSCTTVAAITVTTVTSHTHSPSCGSNCTMYSSWRVAVLWDCGIHPWFNINYLCISYTQHKTSIDDQIDHA